MPAAGSRLVEVPLGTVLVSYQLHRLRKVPRLFQRARHLGDCLHSGLAESVHAAEAVGLPKRPLGAGAAVGVIQGHHPVRRLGELGCRAQVLCCIDKADPQRAAA